MRDSELVGGMPSGLIHDQNASAIDRDGAGRFREVRAHGRRVAPGRKETSPFSLFGKTGTEEIGRSRAMVAWAGWPRRSDHG